MAQPDVPPPPTQEELERLRKAVEPESLDGARARLEADRAARVQAVHEALRAACEKHRCSASVQGRPYIAPDGRIQIEVEFVVVPQ